MASNSAISPHSLSVGTEVALAASTLSVALAAGALPELEFSGIDVNATGGKAHWEAHYLFSATGRKVHNIIDGTFTFTPDGLIATHRDRFNCWRWSRQALGLPGVLLGWSPALKRKVRSTAAGNLKKFLAQEVRSL